jgi:tRNA(fMet)-specific endonuclease VapC
LAQVAAVTAVTVEESLRGWLAEIRRHSEPRRQVPAYRRLITQVDIFSAWLVLPWDDAAADCFDALKSVRQRVGTQDLKIASICLAHDAMLLTRNVQDYRFIPNLLVENWLD